MRDAAEWEAVLARNPFREEAERDPGHLVVTFFKDAPSAKAVKALEAAITSRNWNTVRRLGALVGLE